LMLLASESVPKVFNYRIMGLAPLDRRAHICRNELRLQFAPMLAALGTGATASQRVERSDSPV
jgi:hypothetical protein